MSDSGIDAQARLQAWRAQGAERVDPVRFARIDALARRAADQRGTVRALLDARLAELVEAYAADLATATTDAGRDGRPAGASASSGSALSALLEHVARGAAARGAVRDDPAAAAPHATSAATPSARGMLDDVRRASARARTESQMRQALQDVPENAGPLNSSSLVHRALNLMRDATPGYLLPFMAYVDTLAWLEGMGLHDAQAAAAAPASASGAKRPRAKARNRRA